MIFDSLATVAVVAAVTTSIHIAFTSPTPSPPKKERIVADYTAWAFVVLQVFRASVLVHGAIEVLLLLAQALAPTWLMNDSSGADSISLSPLRLVAGTIILIGGCIRWLAYREMGRHYTYHITVLNDHRLVTTGPYSYLRHPGYAGGDMVLLGLPFWYGATGSWVRESGVYVYPLAWLVIGTDILCVLKATKLYALRPALEDEILKKEFGKQWDEWAKKVPYRLFPGIY